jgi:hypothetical protein
MNRLFTGTVVFLVLLLPAQAAERITREQIQQVMDAADVASMNRDATGIGEYLSDSFLKIVEFRYKKWMARVKVPKDKYLEIIDEGWAHVGSYYYQREDTEIHIALDGLSGMSHSTITEQTVQDGEQITSKFREYATYELENGRPVITHVTGHTLLGDTTPKWQEQ